MEAPVSKVLIFDDSEIVRGIVAVVLGAQGHDVVGVARPAELLGAIDREHPTVVLLDATLPGISGDKIIDLARAAAAKCKVVVFSDRAEGELARVTAASGAAGYVRKGGDPATLAHYVERLLLS
jgi:DNA-binding NarL/FixJ family response regulator